MVLENPIDEFTRPHPNDWIYFSDAAGEVLGSLTPPAWLSELFETVLGTDPVAWVEEQFGGDWAAVSAASNAFDKFADWIDSARHNTGELAYGVTGSWDGNAALAARGHFLDTQASLDEVPELLREMSRATEWVASQMYMARTVASELIASLITLAVSIVIPPLVVTMIPRFLGWLGEIVAWTTATVQAVTIGITSLSGASQRLNALPALDLGLGYDNPLHA